jgi:hypothetical protein
MGNRASFVWEIGCLSFYETGMGNRISLLL